MTTEEQLVIAIETLRTLADKDKAAKAGVNFSVFGSAGAHMAYADVREYAEETLTKMGLPLP